jgi:hypothetical protein|tara:strand:+ start:3782 stop:3898 length:117 start_codon:yes stop_codon:yes gene_type:complete
MFEKVFLFFKPIDETKNPYYKEYGRDYFIPESGYLIFD